ncbi:hypothetical protein NQ317_000413 [Molorchus minor]|uniref:Uncharacterized protein n=1 Tax=Molorchus minor TaxID=1323400 RepID=A0ABQ9JBK1_9CUCU|nr:hypothetical protein NQ317_000413 [Molorchus minor]
MIETSNLAHYPRFDKTKLFHHRPTGLFDKGLTKARIHYRNDSAHLAADFDRIQQTVRKFLLSIQISG